MKRLLIVPFVLLAVTALWAALATGQEASDHWSTTVSVSHIPAGIVLRGPENAGCDAENEGAMRYSKEHGAVLLCDGSAWVALQTRPLEGDGP